MSEPTQELEEDLKTTSEHVSDTAERIAQLEEEKRGLDASDPRVLEISHEVERLASGLKHQVAVERELARAIGEGTDA